MTTGREIRGRVRLAAGAAAAGLLLASCGGGGAPDGRPLVVASTTILGDVAASVAGTEGRVEVLMPVGADPHDFELSAAKAALLAEADLVVWVGGSLETPLAAAVGQAAAAGTPVLELLPVVDPLPADGREPDPHFWFDPLRMATAVVAIGDALAATGVGGGWEERAAAYATELASLDTEIAGILAAVPPERRVLVTNHDSLSYLADRYGFEVAGTVIPGTSSLAEPSSAQLAELVATVRARKVPAIFAETTNPTSLAESLAAEVGDEVEVVALYTGSLGGPGSGAETYPDLLRTDAERIAAALS